MAGAAVRVLHSTEDGAHGDGWHGAPLYARRRLSVHAGALLLQIYGGGNALYPGGDHLLVQDGMAELPGVRAAHGRRPVAGRGIPDLGCPCMSSPPLAAGDGAAIACKIIGRKLATMTPMGVMSLPEGVAEVFLHCISCPCCSTSRRSRIRGRQGCPRRRSRRRGWGRRSSGDYPSSLPRRWQPFLTHSNSEQRPLFRRGQMLFHWRQYLASRCTSATW